MVRKKYLSKTENARLKFWYITFSFAFLNTLAICCFNISNDSFFNLLLRYTKKRVYEKQNSQNIDMIFLSQCLNSNSKVYFRNDLSYLISPTILNFNKNILKSVELPMVQLSAGRPSAQTHHPLVFWQVSWLQLGEHLCEQFMPKYPFSHSTRTNAN